MIYCVWYPSGGFGHFINAVLSLYGENFVRPLDNHYEFSDDGSSHNLRKNTPIYKNQIPFTFNFNPSKNTSVLIDNGITDEGNEFYSTFPNSIKIKLWYSEIFWPVIAKTSIVKAMRSDIKKELPLDKDKWPDDSDWAVREKYFLFLRDHQFRHAWKSQQDCICIHVEDLRNYRNLRIKLESAGIKLNDFQNLWQDWYEKNNCYYKAVDQAKNVISAIKNNKNYDLTVITDLWEQAVIYYILWLEYRCEVPHYDYVNFFKDTDEIKSWLNLVVAV
jgi:hypothetical protein